MKSGGCIFFFHAKLGDAVGAKPASSVRETDFSSLRQRAYRPPDTIFGGTEPVFAFTASIGRMVGRATCGLVHAISRLFSNIEGSTQDDQTTPDDSGEKIVFACFLAVSRALR